jgi:hypothetical protein
MIEFFSTAPQPYTWLRIATTSSMLTTLNRVRRSMKRARYAGARS